MNMGLELMIDPRKENDVVKRISRKNLISLDSRLQNKWNKIRIHFRNKMKSNLECKSLPFLNDLLLSLSLSFSLRNRNLNVYKTIVDSALLLFYFCFEFFSESLGFFFFFCLFTQLFFLDQIFALILGVLDSETRCKHHHRSIDFIRNDLDRMRRDAFWMSKANDSMIQRYSMNHSSNEIEESNNCLNY